MDSSDGSDGDEEGVDVHASAVRDTQFEALADAQPAVFECFYRDHHARIYNLAARIVGDPDDAADITQEVFLRAYTHPFQARDDLRPEPWLYRIAVNASYDHLRRRAARPSTSLDSVPEVADTSDVFLDREIAHCVETCLAGLTPRYRTALVLKDLHGLSHAEIAEVMDIHQGAARVLLHRARAAFRRAFRSTAPTGAGGVSTLGLAAFLPALAVPARLQTPPVVDFAPPGAGPAPAPHVFGSPPGAGPVLAGATPVAAPAGAPVTAAVSAVAPAGIVAGAGGIAGIKVAVAVLATVIATGGGLAAGHYRDVPVGHDSAAALTGTSAVMSPTDRNGTTWKHWEMLHERLQAAGLAPARDDSGPGGGSADARSGPGDGATQSQGGPAAGGGIGRTYATGRSAVTGAGGGLQTTGGGPGSGGTTGESGGTAAPGAGGANAGVGTGGTEAGGQPTGGESGDTPTTGGNVGETSSAGTGGETGSGGD